MKPAVILVGADKGGVGKTTISRAVLDYLAANNVLTRAFDTEFPRGTLKRFHGPITEVVDISQTADQMRILDTLNAAQVKVSVIDTRAGALARPCGRCATSASSTPSRQGEFSFTLFHVLGPSIASLDEIAEVAPYRAGRQLFPGQNHINDTNFFEWDPVTHRNISSKRESAGELDHSEAQRNGLRAGRNLRRALLDLRRQQDAERRSRQPFLCAARLCPHLAGQDRRGTQPRASCSTSCGARLNLNAAGGDWGGPGDPPDDAEQARPPRTLSSFLARRTAVSGSAPPALLSDHSRDASRLPRLRRRPA